MTALLTIAGLEIDLGDRKAPTHVLRGVELDVMAGEAVGLVGESGCGKTTTMLAIAGLLAPGAQIRGGSITFDGQELLTLGARGRRGLAGTQIGCVFQNARNALHPMLSVGRQIARAHALHFRQGARTARSAARELLEQVGLDDPGLADRCPHELSGGQCQRAMIALALVGRPQLLLADEPTSGLDVTVQRQVLETLRSNARDHGTAMILISHDLGVVRRACDRVNVMYAGEVIERGSRDAVLDDPRHPYTRALVAALHPQGRRMSFIPGRVPDLRATIDECAFAARCPIAIDPCHARRPADVELGDGHRARCVRAAEVAVAEGAAC